jgi:hypothetical protein
MLAPWGRRIAHTELGAPDPPTSRPPRSNRVSGQNRERGNGNHTTRFLNARPGDTVTFIGLDLGCTYFRSDPDHHEVGPILYCDRNSEAGKSRAMGASGYHFFWTNTSGLTRIYRVNRAP